ncbi:hypothetical protein [Vibrio harveyi]|uniref:hypothetical protein n=1 Tax=Vibrio harveyi TaxID=669 RepID=UPI003909AB43
MLKRCYDPTNQDYKTYGSIGVYVCSNLYNFQVYAWWYYQECARLGIDSENNNYHVDKDILCNHYGFTTPFYSLDTICLISNTVNSIEAQAEYWLFTSPQGKPETIYNLSKFCKENGLSYGRMLSVYSDTQKSHRGWTKT